MRKMIMPAAACLILCAASVFAVDAPRKIFGFENDKRVENFTLLQDDSLIAIRQSNRLWFHRNCRSRLHPTCQ